MFGLKSLCMAFTRIQVLHLAYTRANYRKIHPQIQGFLYKVPAFVQAGQEKCNCCWKGIAVEFCSIFDII